MALQYFWHLYLFDDVCGWIESKLYNSRLYYRNLAVIAAIIHAPYRLARLTSFLDPWKAVKEGGFQIIQSYIAFYNGNIFGTGLGNSKQKLFFLPEAHTDFILSVVGEELGLVGVSFVILCYLYLIKSGFDIAKNTSDCYKKYLAFGITTLISVQTSINMGVAMGLFPTKGMPAFVLWIKLANSIYNAASILNKIGRDELYKVKKVEIIEPIHFVGIGGTGMRPLAELCVAQSIKFSGSDKRKKFLNHSIRILQSLGHRRENINDCKTLVVSSAIDMQNPKIIEAIERNIPIAHRSTY